MTYKGDKYGKKRLSQFELLRIIAMFLIVLGHSNIHGVLVNSNSTLLKYPLSTGVSLLMVDGTIGIYIFVLITGYFMINSSISFKKIIKLWLPIFFWSLLLYLLFNFRHISIKPLIQSMFPIIFNQYWFMTVYIFMYCLIPFLNIIVNSLDSKEKKAYFLALGLLIVLANCSFLFGTAGNTGSNLLNFCFMYCVGGMIHKEKILHNKELIQKLKKSFFIILILVLILIPILVFLASQTQKILFIHFAQAIMFSNFSWFVLFFATEIFILIGSQQIKYNLLLNKIASLTFGIYLISDNTYVRSWLWTKMLHLNFSLSRSPLIIVSYTILITIIVFIICGLIEFIQKLFIDRLINTIDQKIKI